MLTVHLGRKGRGVRVEGSNSPARLARSLVRNLDEPFVQRQIVADGVLPTSIASVVDPGTRVEHSHWSGSIETLCSNWLRS